MQADPAKFLQLHYPSGTESWIQISTNIQQLLVRCFPSLKNS